MSTDSDDGDDDGDDSDGDDCGDDDDGDGDDVDDGDYGDDVFIFITIKYIETPCEALPASLSQLQTSIIICLSKKSTRFVEARSK